MTDTSAAFLRDVERGLTATPKAIPGKYIWDDRGSQLFDEITRSPSYYPMAAEMALLSDVVGDVADAVGAGACIVEFGSGASRKIRTVLGALRQPARYVALDISADFAGRALAEIARDYPDLETVHVTADYSRDLPPLPVDRSRRTLGYFPGTSVGNMVPDDAVALLGRIRTSLGAGWLLIGQDPNQDAARLQAAYGSAGMAALHTNLLHRLAAELGADLDPNAFAHEARIQDHPTRVEAHLVARAASTVRVGGETILLAEGDTILTDLSWKYPPEAFRELARRAGWTPVRHWVHPERLFALHFLVIE